MSVLISQKIITSLHSLHFAPFTSLHISLLTNYVNPMRFNIIIIISCLF